jgi:hypothetical protein
MNNTLKVNSIKRIIKWNVNLAHAEKSATK